MTDRVFERWLAAIPLAILVLMVGSANLESPYMWGINHLRYYPIWVWIASCACLLGAAYAPVRDRVFGFRVPGLPPTAAHIALVLVGLAIFVWLRDATHLLGDGYLLTRELEYGLRKIANEPFSLWLLDRILATVRDLGVGSADVYSAWSYGSGVCFLILLPIVVRRFIPESPKSMPALCLLLLLPAYSQLFFGYHETYPVLLPLLILYVCFGFLSLRGQLPKWVPCLLLGLMASLHFMMVTVSLSAVLLITPEGNLSTRARTAISNAWVLLPGAFLFVGLLQLAGFDLGDYRARASGETFLPMLGSTTHSIPYPALSVSHLIEFVNEQLLVFLPSLLLLPFVDRTFLRSRESLFLLSAAIPAWVVTFFGFTVIGAFRDWDALAFPALLTTLWAGIGVVRNSDRLRVQSVFRTAGMAAAIPLVLWLGINVDPVRATTRFEDALSHSRLSARARSFGWETLGAYFDSVSDREGAIRSYENAIVHDPRHPRYPNLLGYVLMQNGAFDSAADNFRAAITLDPERYQAHLNLGLSLVQLGRFDAAIAALQVAQDLRGDLAKIPFALGVAFYAKGAYESAADAYASAVELDPLLVDAQLNLGKLYGLMGRNTLQYRQLEIVLEIQPQHSEAVSLREWMVWFEAQRVNE